MNLLGLEIEENAFANKIDTMILRNIIKTLIFLCNIYFCFSKRYDNYTLYRGFPFTESHLNFFKNLTDIYDVNFWRYPSLVKRPTEFILAPEDRDDFVRDAESQGIYLTTLMDDVQRAFDKQTVKAYIRRNMASFDWRDYFRIKDIYSWLRDLQKAHPTEIELQSIGNTYEHRNIMSARVYLKNGPVHRPTVIIEGGIHAREWISPAFVTYFLHQIVTSSQSDNDELKRIAKQYEWIFVPVANPDGYEYTHTTDRNWRKNRRGAGVDLNRNFGYKFGSVGVSFTKTSNIYPGETAFSEYESSALRNLVINNNKHLDFYISFHSYGQYMIIPYAHTTAHLENFGQVKEEAKKAAHELKKLYGTEYTIGTAYDTVGYTVSGASTCWVKHTYKVPYVMTLELRDQGNDGFALPAEQIIPTCKETMAAMISFLSPKPHDHKRLQKEYNYNEISQISTAEAQENKIVDSIVILCNVVLFIIVRFG